MTEQGEWEKVRSYLAAQSAKLSAAELSARIEEATDNFLATLDGDSDATVHVRPVEGEWSVAMVDHDPSCRPRGDHHR